ncbi:unnamed protein product [Thelazia callipaeda]|uniref:PH domain-containing protein n=1 Tax=Thelazia callipaeda TaxID=103827 RepID=A0A0N5DAP5_THECL|nr:unnamed protein product [Thelazia callipaeda]
MRNFFRDKSLQNTPAERPRIGDILLCSVHNALQHYRKFVQNSPIYLAAINEFTRANSAFAESLNRLQMKHSYCFNINFVMLKVIHRMVVWQNLLGRMVAAFLEDCNENETASQLSSCRVALEKKKATLEGLVHFIKFVELGDDLNIIDGLTDPLRRFIRQGWLCKWTKRGFISHVVILFNDALLFAHRSQTSGFIRNAFLPLRSMKVEEGDALHVVTDPTLCLTIRAVGRTFLMSSDCTRVRDIWFEEIRRAIDNAKNSAVEKLPQTETFGAKGVPCSTLDVCWYRHATLGINAIIAAPTNQMSGYLLRKYRNSTEWEKLWVVHANFALIFFQSHQEKEPLALLPIVSYHISLPQLNDEIDCDNVFKVSYNTHCYFFRTDSLYSFSKWYECIRESAISSSPLDVIANYMEAKKLEITYATVYLHNLIYMTADFNTNYSLVELWAVLIIRC